jgi:hypothetical protein
MCKSEPFKFFLSYFNFKFFILNDVDLIGPLLSLERIESHFKLSFTFNLYLFGRQCSFCRCTFQYLDYASSLEHPCHQSTFIMSHSDTEFFFSPPVESGSGFSYSIKWFQPPVDRSCGRSNRGLSY